MASGIEDFEVEEPAVEFDGLGEGVFDGRVVRLDEVFVDELDRETALADGAGAQEGDLALARRDRSARWGGAG